ncbi:hypothetical protein B0187_04650 [Haemophilus paracuniculus]|uniref:Uncharacterized protein n=1 Tax=Haemophilus paracuniculus TaxID=734 RepID=A0A1T0ASX5_9PAST|nr:hypothetical protein [Haemophilus paracuniculus]OOR99606.1 hypothetical protein B0187_04650 [Haemophilus paracuniculus]
MVSESLHKFVSYTLNSNSIYDYLSIPMFISVSFAIAGLFLYYLLFKDRKQLNDITNAESFFSLLFIALVFFTPAYFFFEKHRNNSLPPEERFYKRIAIDMKKRNDLSAKDIAELEKIFQEGITQTEDGRTEYSLDPVYLFILNNKQKKEKPVIEMKPNKYLMEVRDWRKQKEAEEQERIEKARKELGYSQPETEVKTPQPAPPKSTSPKKVQAKNKVKKAENKKAVKSKPASKPKQKSLPRKAVNKTQSKRRTG